MRKVMPYELVKALVDRAGGSLPVAKAMNAQGFQPTLHKFISGHVPQPKHSTAARIADHFGIPLDAIYDVQVATEWYAKLGLGEGGSTAVVRIRPQGAGAATSPLHNSLQAVLDAIVSAPAARWPSIRAQFDQAVQQPDKLGEVVSELEALLERPPGKQVSNGA